MTTPETQTPAITFAELGLPEALLRVLSEVGYETPSPIQAQCIPHLLEGADIIGEAQTGTGKTAAFALPMLARIDLAVRQPQALVLTPTRELAIQVAEALQKYAHHLPGFHVLPIYGGQSMVVQLRALSRGPHVIVGTPGRVMDHLERESLKLDGLRMMVLDEADEMLRMGFIDDVEWILQHTPAERQTALFSATMPEPIRRVARTYLREPREVKIRNATSTVEAIRQRYWTVRGMDKLDALTRILEVEDDFDAAIVFVRTKIATEELAQKLEARGIAAAALNGDMTQGLRERVIEQLKSGALDIVVATDVAARGIDVPRVSHVINYDIPYDTEAYVHRIGRTGRAGRTGSAILFVSPREFRMLKTIERVTRATIEPLRLPTRSEVEVKRAEQFKQQITEVIENEKLEYFVELVSQMEDEQDLTAHEIAAALAWIAQRERPLKLDPAEWPDEPAARPERERERPTRENRDEILAKRREFSAGALARYRIAVGRNDGVMPKEIVGAIANEGGIEGRFIGQINLFPDFSTVELPRDLPADLLQQLGAIRVRRQALAIRLLEEGEADGMDRRPPRREFREERSGGGWGGGGHREGDRGAPRFDERKPQGRWGNDRPQADRPQGDRPPRPQGDRPQGERSWGDRPPRPYGDRPQNPRPYPDRAASDRPAGDRPRSDRPYGDRPAGDRPYGDRPQGDRPQGDKPWGDRPARPQADRPARPWGDRPPKPGFSGEKKPWGKKPTR
ncbi:DEAD/DEAH box helicase [Niveibacterium sp. 24ML]|uniref:DEAD/DEAH box helicase n=1 Tax=Niveibacterium sp. 24ML TaxID=2985512 RepID=UPI00226F0D38|nr:DEAD/DEAH box helicase [Niveibacterium sp. 24ML]MCX9155752.1 DEAD/DEAH box helicase [Niveibacterium sp. 24ML]